MIYQDKYFKEIFDSMLLATAQWGFGLFFIVGKVNSSKNRISICYVAPTFAKVGGRLHLHFLKYEKTFYNFLRILRPLFVINRFLKNIINIIFEVCYFINTVFNFKTFYLRIDSYDCVDCISSTDYRKYKNGFSFYFDNYLYRTLFYYVINIFSSSRAWLYFEDNYDGEVSANENIISEQEYLGSTNSRRDLIAEASEDGHPHQIYR